MAGLDDLDSLLDEVETKWTGADQDSPGDDTTAGSGSKLGSSSLRCNSGSPGAAARASGAGASHGRASPGAAAAARPPRGAEARSPRQRRRQQRQQQRQQRSSDAADGDAAAGGSDGGAGGEFSSRDAARSEKESGAWQPAGSGSDSENGGDNVKRAQRDDSVDLGAIDDLLNELALEPDAPTKDSSRSRAHPRIGSISGDIKRAKTKCFPLCLGSADEPRGLSTSTQRRACSKMRCLSCDHKVYSFDNYIWHERSDYLFFRNNIPDFDKLKSNLVATTGGCAYACQCKWHSMPASAGLQTVQEIPELKKNWVCARHQ